MSHIGQRIREARTRRSWSQARLAEEARVSQPTIANWENGSHSPREAALTRLTNALEVHRLWLLEGYTNAPNALHHAPSANDAGYFATPILHIAVLPWPQGTNQAKLQNATPLRHVAVSVKADAPFALDCDDPALSRAFPPNSTIIFDRVIGNLKDGAFYLFEWNDKALIRRWRSHPERFEPASDPTRFETLFPTIMPRILGRAVMALRSLEDVA